MCRTNKAYSILHRLAVLIGGSGGSQLIVVAGLLLLTRLFEPAHFGVLAAFVALSGLFGAVFCLRYEQAVYLPRPEAAALAIVTGAICIALVFILVFTAVIALMFIMGLDTIMGGWLLLVPVAGGALSIYNLLSNWAVRQHNERAVASTRLTRAVVQTSGQVSLGLLGLVPFGLLFGELLGRIAGLGLLFSLYSRAKCDNARVSAKRIMRMLLRYRKFPLIAAPGALANVAVLQSVPLTLAVFYSPVAAGMYFVVQRLMAAPLALVGQSVAQVLTAELVRKLGRNEKECMALFLWAVCGLFLIGGLPIALVGVFGGEALAFLLGDEWKAASGYLLALTPFFVGQFVMSPLANFLNTLGLQGTLLLWDFSRLLLTIPGLIIPALLGWSPVQALWVFSLIMTVFYIVLFVVLYVEILRRSRM